MHQAPVDIEAIISPGRRAWCTAFFQPFAEVVGELVGFDLLFFRDNVIILHCPSPWLSVVEIVEIEK